MKKCNAAARWLLFASVLATLGATRMEDVAVFLIEDYQARISPRKGYTCAYARVHGGPGCSAYAKRVISQHGLGGGLTLVRRRFKQCYRASRLTIGKRAALRY